MQICLSALNEQCHFLPVFLLVVGLSAAKTIQQINWQDCNLSQADKRLTFHYLIISFSVLLYSLLVAFVFKTGDMVKQSLPPSKLAKMILGKRMV